MKFVDLRAQHEELRRELNQAIAEVIDSSAFVGGPAVGEFEERFAELIGLKHCISCANGTDALFIALRALGLEPGDEVITTAHSWISTSETITLAGGRVVFCDTAGDYFCIDPGKIEDLIGERTRGIIPVHLYGQPADMDPILDVAKRHGLWVLEDAAQAHLAEYKGRRVGTLGDVATFSFYPGKNLGAIGDAGCLVTDRDDIAEFASLFARHGGKGVHVMEGINSRMDTLQAAVLNVKMTRLAAWTSRREQLAAAYSEGLEEIPSVRTPPVRRGCRHVFHLYVVRCDSRDALRAWLDEHGVPTGLHYPRMLPTCPAYSYLGHHASDFPVARQDISEILSLPLHPYLCDRDLREVVDLIRTFYSA